MNYKSLNTKSYVEDIDEKGIVKIRVSAFGRNLAVWGLDNDNFDPEVASTGSGNIQGAEGGSLPSTRSIGFNVELKF